MKQTEGERIVLKDDAWAVEPVFYIRLALFDKGHAPNWIVRDLGPGPGDNATDGEYVHSFYAYSIGYIGAGGLIETVMVIPEFEISANGYSYQSFFQDALEKIGPAKKIDIRAEACYDRRALPEILESGGYVRT